MSFERIGFIGAGKMAQALATGITGSHVMRPDQVMASDVDSSTLKGFCSSFPGAVAATSNSHLVDKCDLIVLAVKPQKLQEVFEEVKPAVSARQLWVSVIAGVQLGRLNRQLGSGRIIRVMPNTPCLIGEGASAFATGDQTTDKDVAFIRQVF